MEHMRFKIERVRYDDGEKAPWWKILIYKNGLPFGESPEYSSFFYTLKLWVLATLKLI